MSDFFRIVRGLEIDEIVRILQGAGPPGLTADTNTALVGSLYLDNTTGKPYSKITAGSGADKWTGLAPVLYDENPVLPTLPSAAADNSVAIGSGAQTLVGAVNAIALGAQVVARHRGAQVFANGRFASSGDAQSGKYVLRSITTTATPGELFLDGVGGSTRLVLTDDSTWSFTVTITGHRTDVGDGHAGYKFNGVIYRQAGAGTTSFQGNPVKSVIAESNPQWDASVSVDTTNGSLRIQVTGQAGKTIRWVALVETVEVTN
jgi:hypothetical protein